MSLLFCVEIVFFMIHILASSSYFSRLDGENYI